MKRFLALLTLSSYATLVAQTPESEEIFQAARPMLADDADPGSRQLGLGLMREAANQGHPKAQSITGFQLAQGDLVPKDLPTAIWYLREAAVAGDSFASSNLRAIAEGRAGGPDSDRTQAWEALKSAADFRSPSAAAQAGELYYFGCEGIQAIDYPVACHYLGIAADQGDISSANTLGVIYDKALLGEADKKLAFRYYDLAAQHGHAKAQANLGFVYVNGEGPERNLIQAYKWFMLSSLQDEVTGRNALADFAHGLSDVQRAEGNRLVAEFFQQKGKEVPAKLHEINHTPDPQAQLATPASAEKP
jgi:TPR repeat protein